VTRILVIDDDGDVRTTIQAVLKNRGFDIVLAECGHSGVAAIEAFAFDAVIVDIFMPDMNGIETIRILRQSAPKVPIIAMSGYVFRQSSSPTPDFLRMALDLGAACCIPKPFKPWEIIKAVEASCCELARAALGAPPPEPVAD
jgi:CheY-like chemotaxis protein